MEYNAPATGDKFKYIAQAMGVDTTGMSQDEYRKAAVDAVRKLSEDVGIPAKLSDVGVKRRIWISCPNRPLRTFARAAIPAKPALRKLKSCMRACFDLVL